MLTKEKLSLEEQQTSLEEELSLLEKNKRRLETEHGFDSFSLKRGNVFSYDDSFILDPRAEVSEFSSVPSFSRCK